MEVHTLIACILDKLCALHKPGPDSLPNMERTPTNKEAFLNGHLNVSLELFGGCHQMVQAAFNKEIIFSTPHIKRAVELGVV